MLVIHSFETTTEGDFSGCEVVGFSEETFFPAHISQYLPATHPQRSNLPKRLQ